METQLFKILEAKAVLRGKFIAIHTYSPKQEKTQINNLIYYLNKWVKEEQAKPGVSRRKEKIKIREEMNKIETKKLKRLMKPRAGLLKR